MEETKKRLDIPSTLEERLALVRRHVAAGRLPQEYFDRLFADVRGS